MLKAISLLSLVTLVICTTRVPGGFYDVEVDSEDVQTAANEATGILSEDFVSPFHYKLVKVVRAQQQVVAGMNYNLKVIVGLTNCKKSDVKYEQIDDCDMQENNGHYKKCQIHVYRNLDFDHKVVDFVCTPASEDEI